MFFQATAKTFGAIILATTLLSPATHAQEAQTPSISVSGTGSINAAPDIATISFGVLTRGETARAALDENNKTMERVISKLLATGIEKSDIQTANFNIQPQYIYPNSNNNQSQQPPRIVGYNVSNDITLIIKDLPQTGKILDEMISLGINSGGNIRFSNDDPSAFLREARAQAVQDAKDKAETLASAANVKLGEILSISEGTPRPSRAYAVQARSLDASSSAVPVASGEKIYSISVQMEWSIQQ